MTNKQVAQGSLTEKAVLDLVQKEKPESIQQLILLIQQTTGLPTEEITNYLLLLQDADKLSFVEKSSYVPRTLKEYLFSKNAAWYWLLVALTIISALTSLLVPDDSYPLVYARYFFGLLFVLFLPGYAALRLAFPNGLIKSSSKTVNYINLVFSVGVSLVVVMIDGLIINYSPWSLTLNAIVFSLLFVTVGIASVSVIRERKMLHQ
jgi:hypothetical protein